MHDSKAKTMTNWIRSWQILEASLEALSRELLVPYVRFSLINGIKLTSLGYADWINERMECQKYMFIYHVTFSFLSAFHLYNEGVRTTTVTR